MPRGIADACSPVEAESTVDEIAIPTAEQFPPVILVEFGFRLPSHSGRGFLTCESVWLVWLGPSSQ